MANFKKYTNPSTENVAQIVATIKGLVLIGGKSIRMGTDKSELSYHGKPQKEYAKEMLENQGFETYYSVGNVISSGVEKSQSDNEIADTFSNLGPFGGVCAAFQKDPNAAWFVLATDLPFVNEDLISLVSEKRNPTKVATAVKGKGKQYPEPLITIYEPKVYPMLLTCLEKGDLSLRKLLIHSDIEIVEVDDELIRNVNTNEEYNSAKKELT